MSHQSRSRLIAVMLLLQLAGLIVPFVLLLPIASPDFLTEAAHAGPAVRTAVLLLFANGGLTLAIGLVAWPLLRERADTAGLALVAVGVVVLALQAVDNAHILAMLGFSRQAADAGTADTTLQAMAGAVRAARRYLHYAFLLGVDAWMLTLYLALATGTTVPRILVAFGITTAVLHLGGIVLPVLVGVSGVALLAMPMALSHVALAGWCLTGRLGPLPGRV